ncbi:MAG: membrane protein YqaA with SNARE-associated domain, partial [Candidatus Azotimanducaceae bacterium]
NGLRELAFEPVPGFTPLPRKLVTVMAGACCEDVNFWVLLSASALSRFPRTFRTV